MVRPWRPPSAQITPSPRPDATTQPRERTPHPRNERRPDRRTLLQSLAQTIANHAPRAMRPTSPSAWTPRPQNTGRSRAVAVAGIKASLPTRSAYRASLMCDTRRSRPFHGPVFKVRVMTAPCYKRMFLTCSTYSAIGPPRGTSQQSEHVTIQCQ